MAPKKEAAPQQTAEEWGKQEPCKHCGARPGRNPETGVEVRDGHTYNCETRMEPAPGRQVRSR